MKNLIYCSLIIIACFTFCKKKDKTTDAAPPNYSGGGTSTTTGGAPSLSPSTGGDYCALQTTYSYFDNGVTVVKDSQVVASFYSTPPSSVAPTNVYGGTVTLNGIDIPFFSSNNLYYSTGSVPNISGPLTWSVSGSGTVTAFSQAYTPSYPKYTGGNLLPDTCIKANGINITISGITNNQSSVVVYLFGGSTSAFKYIIGSSGVISFTPSELAAFPVNQILQISVYLTNSYTATHGGIKRGFINNLNYQKMSYLK